MRKSPDAFRTISEVAQDLDLPQHVLRFWETRFSQIKPMKRGGGRRYYRPDDIDLLKGIRHLLYDEGYTIKGVQRILKEQGVRHVIDTIVGTDETSETATAAQTDAGATSAHQDYLEPNQLEVARPPLVAPRTPAPESPQQQMAHPAGQMPAQGADHPAAQPVHPAAGGYNAPQAAPSAPINHATATAPVPQPAAAVHAIQQAAANAVLGQGDAGPAHPAAAAPNQPGPQAAPPSGLQAGPQAGPQTGPQTGPLTGPYAATALAQRPVAEPHYQDQQPQSSAPQPAQPVVTREPDQAQPVGQPSVWQEPQQLLSSTTPPQPVVAKSSQQQVPTSDMQPPKAANLARMHPHEGEHHGVALPRDLAMGEPKFVSGEAASISVSEAQRVLGEQSGGTSLFNRLRGRSEDAAKSEKPKAGMARDDIRRLQSTLFELLECKRILDQARSEDR